MTFPAQFNLSDLNGTNGFVINGIDASNYSGTSVNGAGKLNGDGINDLIIGAYVTDPNGYIVLGGIRFEQLSIQQLNNNVLISLGNERLLRLNNTQVAAITAADFV